VAAIGALHHDDGAALHDDHASVVMAFRTGDWEWVVGIRHGRREADPTAELVSRQPHW
jgi:hypothetical protein